MTTTRLDWALLLSVALHAALLFSFATAGGLRPGAAAVPEKRPLSVLLPAQGAPSPDIDPSASSPATLPNAPQARQGQGERRGFPSPLAQIEPEYPEAAYALGISGKVEVEVVVDASGRVEDAFVVSTTLDGVFNRSALKAVRETRFAPGMVAGKPTKGVYRAVIVYSLE